MTQGRVELLGELTRWERSGGHWQVLTRRDDRVEVALLSCDGGEMSRVHGVPTTELSAFLAGRTRSTDEPTVAGAMLPGPKVLPADVTVGEVRRFFDDHHVHMALLVDDRSPARLVTTLVRDDVPVEVDDAEPAVAHGQREGRVVRASVPLAPVHEGLVASGRRRLAVVDERGVLLGLLCLKRHRGGFCSPRDVAARAGVP